LFQRERKISSVEEVYGILKKYEFPLHPTALSESMFFAEQAFDEYMQAKE
jgi:hypothetical protein